MHPISNKVYNYYTSHFEELSFEKKFHFASRLYLWNQDEFARTKLEELRAEFTAKDNPGEALRLVHEKAIEAVTHGSKNAAELRMPYFEKYPNLKKCVMLLFRATFLQHIYGYDVRTELFRYVSKPEFDKLLEDVSKDREALAILSTHAINFIYLYSRVINDDEKQPNPKYFLEVGQNSYDLTNPIHMQLYIYLYTHCILGETKFYYRAVPELYKTWYLEMAEEIEELLDDHFEDINMDNKFEHLVCCEILGVKSRHADAIYAEAEKSFIEGADYIIDRHNNNPQTTNTDLDKSEHRNVLCIMASLGFNALGK